LVGNADDDALIETTLSGFTFTANAPMLIAVTGAEADLAIGGVRRARWRGHGVARGDRVMISAARRGVRSYVALSGGVCVAQVMGSRSTDVGSGFGGRVLAAGDEVRLGGDEATPLARPRLGYPESAVPDLAGEIVLRAMQVWVASPRSGRQALRLDGDPILGGRVDATSEGVAAGCVQITGDGSPILLLCEHQTTGGYPVVLCVISADVPRAAQVRPGDKVRFETVGFRVASKAFRTAVMKLRSLGEVLH
jgi:biotin-dependent carboxylase-like uncharacterized protein